MASCGDLRDNAPTQSDSDWVTGTHTFTQALTGRVLKNRFEVGERLGGGAMGDVYRAFDRQTELPVAVKVLNAELLDAGVSTELLATRFLQEIKATARLRHPNIVRMVESGADPDGTLFLVLELLKGRELRELLDEVGGPLETERAAAFTMQLCDALIAAHEAGVVHRDLKPENIFVVDNDVLKVVDFGIARLAKRPELTQAGAAMGTPHYMAPEQVLGRLDVDHRADFYALGVMLFEMLTGDVPFHGDSPIDVAMAQVEREIPPLNLPWVEPERQELWRTLITDLMAKDPAGRPDNAHVLRRRLSGLAGDRADEHKISLGASVKPGRRTLLAIEETGPSPARMLAIGALVLGLGVALYLVAT